MRLSPTTIARIRETVWLLAGPYATVRLFGSRLNDEARGGDMDLLLELPQAPDNPALLSARVAGRLSRLMHGRKVDVLIAAPGLHRSTVHDVALREGVLL